MLFIKIKSISSTWIRFGVLFLLCISVFLPVYPSLIDDWFMDSNNSHGILVPIISAFLIWQKRDQVRQSDFGNSNLGLFILCTTLLFHVLSYAGDIRVLSRLMIVTGLAGLVIYTLGLKIFSTLQFPLLFLFFMVPIPVSIYTLIAFPLQLFATDISAFLINLLTIPAYKEGNMLYFAQTQLEVAEACSGLRSMMSFIMLSFLFAYMMDKNWRSRIIIILSAIPLALFVNIFRVTGTGILAHFYGSKVARGFLHDFSGMVVFAFGFILLFLEYRLLDKIRKKAEIAPIHE